MYIIITLVPPNLLNRYFHLFISDVGFALRCGNRCWLAASDFALSTRGSSTRELREEATAFSNSTFEIGLESVNYYQCEYIILTQVCGNASFEMPNGHRGITPHSHLTNGGDCCK